MPIKIMLDAGHYGSAYNASPCKTKIQYYESNMNWRLCELLKSNLESLGFTVNTTRKTKEEDVGVFDRGCMAKGYDMFISLHSNAVGNYIADGTDWPLIILPMNDNEEQKKFGNLIGETISSVMHTTHPYQLYIRPSEDHPEQDYYGVIRGAVSVGCKMAFIFEHGFHTDTYCTNWLLDDNNLIILAEAEANAIADYYKKAK